MKLSSRQENNHLIIIKQQIYFWVNTELSERKYEYIILTCPYRRLQVDSLLAYRQNQNRNSYGDKASVKF
jgi:hypothetical protein